MEAQDVVRSRLRVLIHERNTERVKRGKKPLTIRQIAKHSGVSTSAITGLTTNRIARYDSATLQALCRFFNCTPGDILEYIPEDEDFRPDPTRPAAEEAQAQAARLEQGQPVTGSYRLAAAKSVVAEYQRKMLKDPWLELD
jgi:putative transcriptional regulator